ncbi:MAG: Y-family DNA polymerase [Candidatus Omnitrophica bacterium]|nr:Y-family DNA polymerase [Candidatus Omnitrophota bacterium]
MFCLVDCNNFYVSCERVFNPKLEKKPVVVLSNNDGCVISRSNQAKALNIKMGALYFKNKDFFKERGVCVYSSNYPLYADMSNRVMSVLKRFCPDIEIYSIDEAFLDFKTIYHKDLLLYAKEIKETVKQWTGIPVSVGLASTKTLAKAANLYAKKNFECQGAFEINDSTDIEALLSEISPEDIWGIGKQYLSILKANNINTALDLRNASDVWIKKNLTISGLRTVWELRGRSCIAFEMVSSPKKQIGCSRSFPSAVTKLSELEEAVSAYVSAAAKKLRRQNSLTSYVGVFLLTNCFNDRPQYSNRAGLCLVEPSSYTPELVGAAIKVLKVIFREGYRYKKLGVFFKDISSLENFQYTFSKSQNNRNRQNSLMNTVDKLNSSLGTDALKVASQGISQSWRMRQNKLSFRFTTRWSELPVVK